ncbi:MAG: Uncharacterised protein [Formosa sp. Hel1_33_131]|nr:MAG: Uncharacterised protein [Formosa sp. Hel1_33_131]
MKKITFLLMLLTVSLGYSHILIFNSSSNDLAHLNLPSTCSGTTTEATDGTFSAGLDYEFVTNGADVTITFTLLDTDKQGLSPQLFRAPSTFTDFSFDGTSYSVTLTDQTAGATLSFQFRGAYMDAGLIVSKVFNYKVGEGCVLSTETLETALFNVYPNPAKSVINISSTSNEVFGVSVYDLLGKQVLRAENVKSQLNISSLNPGLYVLNMTQGSNSSTQKLLVK